MESQSWESKDKYHLCLEGTYNTLRTDRNLSLLPRGTQKIFIKQLLNVMGGVKEQSRDGL